MSSDSKSELESIVVEATEIASEPARREFIARRCRGNRELQCQAERLVACHFEAGAFLEAPCDLLEFDHPHVSPVRGLDRLIGETIQNYRIIATLGEGGFARVFRAQQFAPVRRMVALKIIKPGMDSRQIVNRFETERQVLAQMDHPNIAKFFDAGTTEDGLPYFVMELVEGRPITDYCDSNRLPIRKRLDVFLTACLAVQHAHQKVVIHRDLKPSNVLVAGDIGNPCVKVIDFGIAKAMDSIADDPRLTRTGQFVGTPIYMSPEQAGHGNLDVDTRGDVYSLGVMLFELLVGVLPFDASGRIEDVRRVIGDEEPPSPSQRLSTLSPDAINPIASHRRVDPHSLYREIRGDLDWIALKAIDRDRERRYESVSAFAADLKRYLNGEPVEASPPSSLYRARKFIQRYRGAILSISALALSVAIGASFSVWKAIDANRARRLADRRLGQAEEAQAKGREAVKRFLTRVGDEKIGAIAEMKELRKELLGDAAEFYTQLIELRPDDAQAHLERAGVYFMLGENAKSLNDFERAISLDGGRHEYYAALANFLSHCPDNAFLDARRAITELQRAVALAPGNTAYHLALAERFHGLEEASREEQEIRLAQSLDPSNPYLVGRVALFEKRYSDAAAGFRQSVSHRSHFLESLRYLTEVQVALGDHDAAIDSMSQAISAKPNDPTLASYYATRAWLYWRRRDYERTLADLNAAIAVAPTRSFVYKERAWTHFELGHFEQSLADLTKAVELHPFDGNNLRWIPPVAFSRSPKWFQEGVLALSDKTIRTVVSNRGQLASAHATRGALSVALGDHNRARLDFLKASEIKEMDGMGANRLALLYLSRGERDAYRILCQNVMLSREKGGESDRGVLTYTIATVTAAPGAIENYDGLLRLANRLDDPGMIGLASFRAGRFGAALNALLDAERLRDDVTWGKVIGWHFLAMASLRSGHQHEAVRWRDKAFAATEQLFRAERDENGDWLQWHRRVTLELLNTEVRALFESPTIDGPRHPAQPSERGQQ